MFVCVFVCVKGSTMGRCLSKQMNNQDGRLGECSKVDLHFHRWSPFHSTRIDERVCVRACFFTVLHPFFPYSAHRKQ